MITKHFKMDPHAVSRLHWKVWVVTGLIAVAGPSIYKWQLHRQTVRAAEVQALRTASQKRVEQLIAPIRIRQDARLRWRKAVGDLALRMKWWGLNDIAFRLMPDKPATRQELEKVLNNGVAFKTTSVTRNQNYFSQGSAQTVQEMVELDADGGPPLRFYFQNDLLMEWEDPSLPSDEEVWGYRLCTWIHENLQQWGPKLWLASIALPFLLRRHRIILAELITALALLLSVAVWPTAALMPSAQTWQVLAQNPKVAWSFSMLSTSAAALAWAMLSQANVSRIRCPLCGYNLRGNTAECCPECGTAIPREIRERLAAFPIKPLSQTA